VTELINAILKRKQNKKDITFIHKSRNWDSAVGIATGYGWTTEGSEFEPQYGQEFSPLHIVQTCSGAHTVSSSNGKGEVKRPRREADHSPPASAEVKKMWTCTSTPPYAFIVQCLIN
jgi:hypothetical protein